LDFNSSDAEVFSVCSFARATRLTLLWLFQWGYGEHGRLGWKVTHIITKMTLVYFHNDNTKITVLNQALEMKIPDIVLV
jgi:hypothetical protein